MCVYDNRPNAAIDSPSLSVSVCVCACGIGFISTRRALPALLLSLKYSPSLLVWSKMHHFSILISHSHCLYSQKVHFHSNHLNMEPWKEEKKMCVWRKPQWSSIFSWGSCNRHIYKIMVQIERGESKISWLLVFLWTKLREHYPTLPIMQLDGGLSFRSWHFFFGSIFGKLPFSAAEGIIHLFQWIR